MSCESIDVSLFRGGFFRTSGKMQAERELPSALSLVGPAAAVLAELCLGEDVPSAHKEGELQGTALLEGLKLSCPAERTPNLLLSGCAAFCLQYQCAQCAE